MERVLVIEDETKIREKLVEQLRREGFQVESLWNEEDLNVPTIQDIGPKVLILDRLLGRSDSISLIPPLKKVNASIGILVLSAIDSPLEKAKALEAGADDYLSKPFSMTELIARVRALARRFPTQERRQFKQLGNVVLDNESRTLTVDGKKSHLTNKEFAVFRLLAETPGRVFSKQRLLEEAWDIHADVESNAVETTITALRRRLEDAKALIEIKNMRNSGYWIEIKGL